MVSWYLIVFILVYLFLKLCGPNSNHVARCCPHSPSLACLCSSSISTYRYSNPLMHWTTRSQPCSLAASAGQSEVRKAVRREKRRERSKKVTVEGGTTTGGYTGMTRGPSVALIQNCRYTALNYRWLGHHSSNFVPQNNIPAIRPQPNVWRQTTNWFSRGADAEKRLENAKLESF